MVLGHDGVNRNKNLVCGPSSLSIYIEDVERLTVHFDHPNIF